jgi:NAD(P) transhydrogenase subunit alpha
MVEGMRPGSIIVDLAASTGGNCELTVNGEDVNVGGVTIIGTSELPSAIATNASQLYAKNLVNFLLPMIKEGQLEINLEDEVVSATCVVYKGEVRHGPTKELLAK